MVSLALLQGSFVTYIWNWGDGGIDSTNNRSIHHTFTSLGIQHISLTLKNDFMQQEDYTTIIIQEKLNPITISSVSDTVIPGIIIEVG